MHLFYFSYNHGKYLIFNFKMKKWDSGDHISRQSQNISHRPLPPPSGKSLEQHYFNGALVLIAAWWFFVGFFLFFSFPTHTSWIFTDNVTDALRWSDNMKELCYCEILQPNLFASWHNCFLLILDFSFPVYCNSIKVAKPVFFMHR